MRARQRSATYRADWITHRAIGKRTTILNWLALPELPRGEQTSAAQPGATTEQATVAPTQPAVVEAVEAVDAPFVNKERFAQEYLAAIGYPEEANNDRDRQRRR